MDHELSSRPAQALLTALRSGSDAMVDHLAELVSIETPSEDLAACERGAGVIEDQAIRLLGRAGETVDVDGRRHLRWRWEAPAGSPSVLLVGHYDTVWPLGTLARWPFAVDRSAGKGPGPGCFDMKAGIVQLFHAVAALDDRCGIEILLTCDEELGSQTSRTLVEEAARRSSAALILEASANGAVKTGRKGTGMYRLDLHGRAAHAGLEPEKGVNALTELAHALLAVDRVGRPQAGTTVTPTLGGGGTASNVVPAHAYLEFDVRVALAGEAERVDEEMKALAATIPGATPTLRGGPNRPPMPESSCADLYARAREIANEMGLGPLEAVTAGGASDGNFTAGVGCPTLDGLGAVGDGAHAEGEWVDITAMPQRAALLAQLVNELRTASHPSSVIA